MHKKVAVITGASRGIGKTVATGLAKDGYLVCLLARSKDKLQEVAKLITQENKLSNEQQPLVYECDVTNAKQVEEIVADIVKRVGQIDLLFNNAGILHFGTLENAQEFNELINEFLMN